MTVFYQLPRRYLFFQKGKRRKRDAGIDGWLLNSSITSRDYVFFNTVSAVQRASIYYEKHLSDRFDKPMFTVTLYDTKPSLSFQQKKPTDNAVRRKYFYLTMIGLMSVLATGLYGRLRRAATAGPSRLCQARSSRRHQVVCR